MPPWVALKVSRSVGGWAALSRVFISRSQEVSKTEQRRLPMFAHTRFCADDLPDGGTMLGLGVVGTIIVIVVIVWIVRRV
jgi:hypothetical protein